MTEEKRERVVRWSDPAATAVAGRDLTGVEFLTRMREGLLPPPPALALLGIEMGEIESGRVTMRLAPGEHLFNPIGSVHGGMITTILDSVMGCAVHSTLPRGRGYTTLELKVNFLRAVTAATGVATAEGRVLHAGRQTALAEARLTTADGKLCAMATSTCLIFDHPNAGTAA